MSWLLTPVEVSICFRQAFPSDVPAGRQRLQGAEELATAQARQEPRGGRRLYAGELDMFSRAYRRESKESIRVSSRSKITAFGRRRDRGLSAKSNVQS